MKHLTLVLLIVLLWSVGSKQEGLVCPQPIQTAKEVRAQIPHKKIAHAKVSPAKLTEAQLATKGKVALLFPDEPRMLAVIQCESKFRQFTADGTPLYSHTNDVGVAQINIPTWGAEAKRLGLDIYNSEDDNLTMARIVLQKQGITAWTCYGG